MGGVFVALPLVTALLTFVLVSAIRRAKAILQDAKTIDKELTSRVETLANSVSKLSVRVSEIERSNRALKALVDGSVSRVGLDLERLKELKSANYKPLMEYLGYIQVQRGGNETLLFVRMKDLDEMAALAGQSREEFLKQFKKLGVLLSMN